MKDYFSSHGVPYEQPKNTAYGRVPFLQFLYGHPWNEIALCYVHALKPTCIRVIRLGRPKKTDARPGRVTVYVDKDDTILGIKQEIEVGLDGIKTAYPGSYGLDMVARDHGINLEANL